MASNSRLIFRPIEEKDIPFLAALYASTRQAEMAQSGWSQAEIDAFLLSQFQLQHQYYQQHYKTADFHIVQYDNLDIGRLYTQWEKDKLRLIDIALLPAFQKQGFGRQMLGELLTRAQEKQLEIRLFVESTNPAYHWYSRLGFTPIGENGVYQQMCWSPEPVIDTIETMETSL